MKIGVLNSALFILYIILLTGGTTTVAVQHEVNSNSGVAENIGAQHHIDDPQVITMDNLDEFLEKLKYADGWAGSDDSHIASHYEMDKKQADKLKLIEKINDIQPEELSKMLKTLGYENVELGDHQTREVQERNKNTKAQYCETTTRYHTSIAPENADVFIEEDSAIEVRSTTGDPVACACDEFDCTCRKQCFCKVQSEPFQATPAPACKKCVNCDGSPSKPEEGDDPSKDEPERPAPSPFEFKCDCSFDGSGGDDEPNKSAMDCDCKVSDCKCTRKCKCRTQAT